MKNVSSLPALFQILFWPRWFAILADCSFLNCHRFQTSRKSMMSSLSKKMLIVVSVVSSVSCFSSHGGANVSVVINADADVNTDFPSPYFSLGTPTWSGDGCKYAGSVIENQSLSTMTAKLSITYPHDLMVAKTSGDLTNQQVFQKCTLNLPLYPRNARIKN